MPVWWEDFTLWWVCWTSSFSFYLMASDSYSLCNVNGVIVGLHHAKHSLLNIHNSLMRSFVCCVVNEKWLTFCPVCWISTSYFHLIASQFSFCCANGMIVEPEDHLMKRLTNHNQMTPSPLLLLCEWRFSCHTLTSFTMIKCEFISQHTFIHFNNFIFSDFNIYF